MAPNLVGWVRFPTPELFGKVFKWYPLPPLDFDPFHVQLFDFGCVLLPAHVSSQCIFAFGIYSP
jgi:hypothetical protein